MDRNDNFGAIIMPSRTIMLTGIPPELNNTETLHSYFCNFGSLLWVNERYENDPETALITFFSIAEAISVFMSNESILDINSIQKSWFEYTKKCELCSYKYSSQDSIKKHMEQYHMVKKTVDIEQNVEKFANDIANVNSNVGQNVEGNRLFFYNFPLIFRLKFDLFSFFFIPERDEQPKIRNLTPVTQNVRRNKNEHFENEMTSLKRKNSGLSDALNKSEKQCDIDRTEISTLIDKLASMEAEKLNAIANLKGLFITFFFLGLIGMCIVFIMTTSENKQFNNMKKFES